MTLKATGPGQVKVFPNIDPYMPIEASMYNFDHDGDRLKQEHASFLNSEIVPKLKSGRYGLWISGRASKQGSASYNMQLSKRRVDSVFAHLTSQGVPTKRIQKNWSGEYLSQQPDPNSEFDRCVRVRLQYYRGGHSTEQIPDEPPTPNADDLFGALTKMWMGVGCRLGGGFGLGYETYIFHCWSLDPLTPDHTFNMAIGGARLQLGLGGSAQGCAVFIGGVNCPSLDLGRSVIDMGRGFRGAGTGVIPVGKAINALANAPKIFSLVHALINAGRLTANLKSDAQEKEANRAAFCDVANLYGVTAGMSQPALRFARIPPNVGLELAIILGQKGEIQTRDDNYSNEWLYKRLGKRP